MLIMVAHIFFQAMVVIYGSSSVRLRIDRVRLNRTPFHASFFKKKKELFSRDLTGVDPKPRA